MTFQDAFPARIEFEVDRAALQRFYRVQGFVIAAVFPLLASFPLICSALGEFWRTHDRADLTYKFGISVIIVVGGIALGLLLSTVIYFAYFHRAAALYAQNQRLLVEGPYLRMIQGAYVVSDRRFHFRDVHNYSTIEGPILRRLGLKTLTFRTDQRQGSSDRFDGLKNPDEVRDMLCELDALRTPMTQLIDHDRDHNN